MFQQKGESEDLDEIAVAFADVAGQQAIHFGFSPNFPQHPLSSAEVAGPHIRLPKLLVALGLAASGAEANRKIAEKAVKLDGEVARAPSFRSLPCPRGSWCAWARRRRSRSSRSSRR